MFQLSFVPRSCLLLVLCLSLCAGCGSTEKRRQVSGTVHVKGQPLDNGVITFFAKDGPPGPAGGALIRAGRFEMPAKQGLEPGTYRITLSAAVPGGTRTPAEIEAGASVGGKETMPEKYNSITATVLSTEVKADGDNNITLQLE